MLILRLNPLSRLERITDVTGQKKPHNYEQVVCMFWYIYSYQESTVMAQK